MAAVHVRPAVSFVSFDLNLNPPQLVADFERLYRSGMNFLKLFLHFLSREKKTKQQKTPLSRFILRLDAAAGARGNSPTLRRAQTVRVLLPVRRVDARRGTRENKKP